jgi:hypothetical protein
MLHKFTPSNFSTIENALQSYFHETNTKLQRKDLGTIERKQLEVENERAKELLTAVSPFVYTDEQKAFNKEEVNYIIAFAIAHPKMTAEEMKTKTEQVWESFNNPNETNS